MQPLPSAPDRRLGALARRLKRQRLPGLFALTDPARTPDPLALAARAPRGAAFVYRAFGAGERWAIARALRRITRRRGVLLLIGADAGLARAVGADGVHLPERAGAQARALKRNHPAWVISVAAHSSAALRRAAAAGADAALLSPVFESASASAGKPLGARRAAAAARRAGLPVIALGGIDGRTAGRLGGGFSGIAAVAAFAGAARDVRT